MKVLHLGQAMGTGGTEILIIETIKDLDVSNNILCYLHPPDYLLSQVKNKIFHLEYNGKKSILKCIIKLRKIIKQNQIDIVHSHLMLPTLLARFAVMGSKTKLIFSIHNKLSEDAFKVNKLSLLAEKLTYNLKQSIIGVSKSVLEDYDEYVGIKGNSFVLYNFVNDEFFAEQFQPRKELDGAIKLVAVGTLRRQKNYIALLRALALVKVPVELDIYGEGQEYDKLQNLIDKLNLKVRLCGRQSNIHQRLCQYDAYIMCSLFEGFGIAPMEAMAVGLPVLLSDIDVFREVTGSSPIYFDPKSASKIAESIDQAYGNWEIFAEKSKGNKEYIKEFATKEAYLKSLITIYNQL